MRETGIDISKNQPKLLNLEMMDGVDRAITMGCENSCPVTTVETEDWDLEDPEGKPIEKVRKIRDEIKDKVINLIEQLQIKGVNMPEDKSSSDSRIKVSKKLTLPDGFRVGIVDLDNILKEVANLKLTDAKVIRAELLQRVKDSNYIPSSAENEYTTALYQEYLRKTGVDQDGNKPEIHQHTKG
jgi:hypothetical protein